MGLFFAPVGALTRWGLSRLNSHVPPIPWFTLLANILGCIAAGSATVQKRQHEGFMSAIWAGFGFGFAGSVSTVSTFVSELLSEKLGGLRLRFRYCLLSF